MGFLFFSVSFFFYIFLVPCFFFFFFKYIVQTVQGSKFQYFQLWTSPRWENPYLERDLGQSWHIYGTKLWIGHLDLLLIPLVHVGGRNARVFHYRCMSVSVFVYRCNSLPTLHVLYYEWIWAMIEESHNNFNCNHYFSSY